MAADNFVLLVTFNQLAICILGICLNCAIIWITIKNKNLQNSYGYLLAIYSLSEVIYETSSFPSAVLTLLNTKIPLATCFYLIGFQTSGGATSAAISMLLISLDRLLATLFPVSYAFITKYGHGRVRCVHLLMIVPTIDVISIIIFNWLHVLQYTNENPSYCQPSEQFGGPLAVGVYRDVSRYNLLIAYLATIIVYIILGIYLKATKPTTSSSSQLAKTRQIYKSLAIIMCVIFLFYFAGFVGVFWLVPLTTNNAQMAFLLSRLYSVFIFMAGAVNAPVLYFCRNLQNSYGYLLAIYSISEIIFESSSFPSAMLTLLNIKISLITCFYLIGFQANGAIHSAALSLLLISLDRLLATLFPVSYSSMTKYSGGSVRFVHVLTRLLAEFIFMAGAVNAPVLYFCSSVYRNAMNQQFLFITPVLKFCQNVFFCRNQNANNAVHVQPAPMRTIHSQLT